MDASRKVVFFIVLLFCSSVLILPLEAKRRGTHLHLGFYSKTCPRAETIVNQVVAKAFSLNSTIPAGLIRLFFHDCFVNGCDASILLDSTPSGELVEKKSPFNGDTLRGLEVIDKAKKYLERECPGIVSCTDILAFASRDASMLSGIPYYSVPGGRRDGRSSLASNIPGNLPTPFSSVNEMISIFNKKGFSVEDMVTLTGAHSIGVSHCSTFSHRLYNYNMTTELDPSLNKSHSVYLKSMCPKSGLRNGLKASQIGVSFDESPTLMDTKFYANLLKGKALLQSDQILVDDPRTSKFVNNYALKKEYWGKKFGKAMVWLGKVDVLTREEGEVRRNCRSVN